MVPVVSVIFTFSALPFIVLGSAMGREFKNFPALYAYAINTTGSLAFGRPVDCRSFGHGSATVFCGNVVFADF